MGALSWLQSAPPACLSVSNSTPCSVRSRGHCSRPIDPRVWKRRSRAADFETELASTSSSDETENAGPQFIELEFHGPQGGSEKRNLTVESGEKNLRKCMLENKLELYGLYGKVMNCGGGGSCGTCIVEILEGQELLSERTDPEYKYLKKNPESWRLACQVIVGNKVNSGKVVIQQLPQNKKK